MDNWNTPALVANRFERRSKRRRVFSLSLGLLALAVAAPELGILPWTPVRGDTKSAPARFAVFSAKPPLRTTALSAENFATPWIVPDPPPLASNTRPPTTSGVHTIRVSASSISWVTVCADGRKVFERLFEAGTTVQIPFSRLATLRSGNAGALDLDVAGHSVGPMGPWGAVRMIKATPSSFEFVEPVISSGCDPS